MDKKILKPINQQELNKKILKKEKCLMDQTLDLLYKIKNENLLLSSSEATNNINDLIRHSRTNCRKCPKDSVYLILGVSYFELFKNRLYKFKNLVINKEATSFEKSDEDKNWDQIKIKNSDTFNELINLDSQTKILEYLFKTIDIWKKLLDIKEKLKSDLILQLDIFELLRNCYFIFSFYGVPKYQKLTSTIYLELVLLHGQHMKNHLIFAYYCQIRFCLDYGLLNKAKNYLKTSTSILNNLKKNKTKSLLIEFYLIKIVNCELKLLLKEDLTDDSIELYESLNDEFFKSITVVSGYIKCLTLYFLTKISAQIFPKQDLNYFFNESFIFTKSLFCKWYPCLSENSNEKNFTISTPLWLEFAVSKFTLEFSLTFYQHSINCSVADLHFFYNILVTRLSRIYCSILWLSKVIILTCYYEKTEVQKIKIDQVKNLFLKGKSTFSKSIKIDKTINDQKHKIDENESIKIQDEIQTNYLKKKDSFNCSHEEETPIYILKKSMLKYPIQDSEDNLFTSYDYEKELENLDNFFIPDLIIIKQEILILLNFINEKKNFIKYFKSLNLDSLNNLYFDNLSKAISIEKVSLNKNYQNLITSSFNMRCLLIYLQNIKNEITSVIDLTRNILKSTNNLGSSYEIHCFISEIVFFYINSLFQEISSNKLNIVEYDYIECDKLLAKPSLADSPVNRKNDHKLRIRSRAPKKMKNYKMDEIKDYIEEMYELDCKKNSIKLNFTDSDEENSSEKSNKILNDQEKLRAKIEKLKSKRYEISSKSKENVNLKLKENKVKNDNLSDNDLSDLNNGIVNLCLDYSFENDGSKFLIDESKENFCTEFKKLLEKILDIFGNLPSIKHYNLINEILYKLSIYYDSSFADEAPYYFSEICQANALRLKTLQSIQKKKKYIPLKVDTKVLEFHKIENKSKQIDLMLSKIPETWRIVQIQFLNGSNSQPDLYIVRYQKNQNPIQLKININSEKFCSNFTKEFDEIIKLSNDTVKEKDSKSFWKLRFALDERLKKLLIDVNTAWISCFIGFFLGQCLNTEFNLMFKEIEKLILSFSQKNNLICKNLDILRIISESVPYIKEEYFNHAMITIFSPKCNFDHLYDQCFNVVKKFFKFKTLEEFNECILKKVEYAPVGLITGPTLENFPFESLFCLRMLNSQFFRIPSIRFLNWMYVNLQKNNQRIKQGFSDKDVYFLINPSNNLSFTEEYFKDKFEQLKIESNWDGKIGKIPAQIELQKALEKKDIYIYFGHNSGVRYIGKFHEFNVNCLSLVIGCSSAALSNQDEMVECFGSSYYFLINGCPTYLGCLWNVTDRDIDRFAERLLNHLFKVYGKNDIEKCQSVAKAVALSRDVCKLKYLNGSAPVIRGLPLSMRFED